MASYGWVTDSEADTYFSTRMGASAYWCSGADQPGSLTLAYTMLTSGAYSFPTTATDSMKTAQFEQALFLLGHQSDMDARLGLQAQGVREAGIVKEKYDGGDELPVCVIARQLLSSYKTRSGVGFATITREDD